MSNSAIRTILVLLALVVLLGVVVWLVLERSADQEQSAAERSLLGARETPAVFTDIRGNQVAFDAYLESERYVVVTSWASWCPQCAAQLADLNSFAQTHADVLDVVAINRSERPNHAQQFLNTLEDHSALEIVLDPDDRFYSDIAGYTIPETVVYDPSGAVVHHFHGVATADDLAALATEQGW